MRTVFLTFLRLGLTSFGGPIAHLGYFRREFVERRGWLDEDLFAQVVAFCSILPGPTSSQVGLIVGFLRAGPGGALAAWLGFTLPSAVALGIFGGVLAAVERPAAAPVWLSGLLAGLGAAATAIVAQAVLTMARSQCPERVTQTIAFGSATLALALAQGPAYQWVPIAAAALAGALVCRGAAPLPAGAARPALAVPAAVSAAAGAGFIALALTAGLAAHASGTGFLLATVARAGSLVFGGGHVVLPLLAALVPGGLISAQNFYAGYGAAQAVPGPLFTFAAFLGMLNTSPLHGPAGAVAVTVLIFAPSFLLVFALLPILGALRTNAAAAGALRGANAGVVGLLGAVLYSPLLLTLSTSAWRCAIALATFALVALWRVAPAAAVAGAAAAGAALAAAGALP